MSKRGQSKTSQHSQGQGSGLPEISLEPIVKQLRDFIDSEQTSIRYIAEDPIYGLPKAKSLGAKLSKDLLIPEKLLPLVASDDLLRRALGTDRSSEHPLRVRRPRSRPSLTSR
jgi:hypothetical protein